MRSKVDSKHRSKLIDAKLYKEMMECLKSYLTYDKLQILNYPSSTPLYEAMDNLASLYAPKTKTFCRNTSLKTRVCKAVAVQALGYQKFWTRIFDTLGLTIDDSVAASLKTRDRKKIAK